MSKQFKCKQCGGCCGPIPLMKNQLELLKSVIKIMHKNEIGMLKLQVSCSTWIPCVALFIALDR